MALKVYLAARYTRRLELVGYREELEKLGFKVTSRWLNGDHQIDDKDLKGEYTKTQGVKFAEEDIEDLERADICISFTEEPRSGNSRGGRHVEFGYALASGNPCIVVGPRENVFHCLPEVTWFPDWRSCLEVIETEIVI